jgi:hypothetical protein
MSGQATFATCFAFCLALGFVIRGATSADAHVPYKTYKMKNNNNKNGVVADLTQSARASGRIISSFRGFSLS